MIAEEIHVTVSVAGNEILYRDETENLLIYHVASRKPRKILDPEDPPFSSFRFASSEIISRFPLANHRTSLPPDDSFPLAISQALISSFDHQLSADGKYLLLAIVYRKVSYIRATVLPLFIAGRRNENFVVITLRSVFRSWE